MAAAKNNTYTQNRKINPTYTQTQIDNIIEKLLAWAHNGEGIYIASFIYEEFKQPATWIYNLARSHKDLESALEATRQLISGKIANHSFKGDRNSTFGEKILPMYSKEYKDLKEWQAKLNKTQDTDESFSMQDILKLAQAGTLLKAMSQTDEKKNEQEEV